jgi:HTH-type transcriptional regulator, competence development regulator
VITKEKVILGGGAMAGKTKGKKVGATLKKMRLEKGMGLQRLADKVGVTPGYLSQIEHGEGSRPTEKMVSAIAKALGAHPDELLALAGHVAPDLAAILQKSPLRMGTFLRVMSKLSKGEIDRLTKFYERRKHPRF